MMPLQIPQFVCTVCEGVVVESVVVVTMRQVYDTMAKRNRRMDLYYKGRRK